MQHGLTLFRRSPGVRSVVYLGTAAMLMQTLGRSYGDEYATAVLQTHLTILPFGATVTALSLLAEGQSPETLLPAAADARDVALGAGLGTAVALVMTGLMVQRGWASHPAWGWERAGVNAVLRATALQTVGHLAVAWNEEQVFRGYGLDTLEAALGTRGAAAVLIPLFAIAHPWKPAALMGNLAAGLLLTLLRQHHRTIWLGLGYHWAWNVVEAAVFGPANELPAIRPMELHGPVRWVGRPGFPEPGLLVTLTHLAAAGVVGLVGWWRARRFRSSP